MSDDRTDVSPPAKLHRADPVPVLRDDGSRDGPGWLSALLGFAALAGTAWLAWALLAAPTRPPLLPELVATHLGDSGVSNPVTAVLLNFRAYDTLLEVVVLAVAMAAVWSMDRGTRELGRDEAARSEDPVLDALARLVVPLVGVMVVYLVWSGSHRSGGAFQAGALLAGAGVLLTAAGILRPPTAASRVVRGLVVLGIYVFGGIGFGVVPWTGAFLGYPEGWAYPLILTAEAVLTVSIAVVLVELFVDVPSVPDPDPSLEELDPTGDPLGRVLLRREDDASEEGPGGRFP